MFTGLVEDIGTVERTSRRGEGVELSIAPRAMRVDDLVLGESVAIDGTCLTVTSRGSGRFQALAGNETLAKTTMGELRGGSKVNLERAVRVGDRLGGHIVAGHVDGVGRIRSKRDLGANVVFVFEAPRELLRYVIPKGSIAIDGISLTVNEVDDYTFAVALIPHTVEATTLAGKTAGNKVNLEVDMIGKYVEKLVTGYAPGTRR